MADSNLTQRISAFVEQVGTDIRALRTSAGRVGALSLEEDVSAGSSVTLPDGLTFNSGALLVSWNGLDLEPGVSYSENDDNASITIMFPAAAGDVFLFHC